MAAGGADAGCPQGLLQPAVGLLLEAARWDIQTSAGRIVTVFHTMTLFLFGSSDSSGGGGSGSSGGSRHPDNAASDSLYKQQIELLEAGVQLSFTISKMAWCDVAAAAGQPPPRVNELLAAGTPEAAEEMTGHQIGADDTWHG